VSNKILNQLDGDCIQLKTSLLWVILGLRIALFSIELGTAIWSHSLSLLAGAGHLFADLLTLGLTFIAAWVVQRQPLEQTTQTEQRLKAWIRLINGISLGAIALLIAQEAVKHIQAHESVASLPVLLVAGLSLAANAFVVYLLYRHRDRDLNLRGVFLHGVADATSALSALVAASVMYWFDWLWADAAASLFVVLVISFSALSLIKSAWQMLRQDSSYLPPKATVM
jgi:cobalt-zinc-cadmium efflux system protein